MEFQRIRFVLFDFDGTLRINRPHGSDVLMDFFATQGMIFDGKDRWRAERWEHLYWANSPELASDVEVSGDDEDAFWTQYARRYILTLGGDEEQAAHIAPLAQAYMKENYQPVPEAPEGTHETLSALREARLQLAVLSNRKNPYDHRLREVGLETCFDRCLAAGQLGAYKPDPAVFHRACEQIGCRAAQAVYVGDNYFADVIGARAAGLRPVLYDPRHLFPEANCPVITDFRQLPAVLKALDDGKA